MWYYVWRRSSALNQGDTKGATPVFVAAQQCKLAMVKLLAEELGADVGSAHVGNATFDGPLFVASQKGDLDMVQCLAKELGADVNQCNTNGAIPLHIAIKKGHVKMVREGIWCERRAHDIKWSHFLALGSAGRKSGRGALFGKRVQKERRRSEYRWDFALSCRGTK
jgi:hypothetical protein